jgi:hypothetical protein
VLLLLGFEAGIDLRRLLLGMMYRAGQLDANLPQFCALTEGRSGTYFCRVSGESSIGAWAKPGRHRAATMARRYISFFIETLLASS